MRFSLALCLFFVAGSSAVGFEPPETQARAVIVDPVYAEKLRDVKNKAIAFLKGAQDAKLGAWGVHDGAAPFPAMTGLVVAGLVMDDTTKPDDAAVLAGVKYMISAQKPDGGIYEAGLPSYNTAICLSALAKVDATRVPQVKDAIASATAFLKGLQYSEDVRGIAAGEAPNAVQKEHAFYGGWGYGKHGRPDLSNTHWALDGLHDAGVAPDDAAFQRALVFLSRCQMSDVSNDMAYADGAAQGGFIYATSENKDKIASGQSMAGTIEETLDDGTKVSRLRAYGSMTYAGFKSYLYAGLTKDDPRVVAAMKWIGENYTLAENPGAGTDGYYYYLVTFARALEASGQKTISGPAWKEPGGTGKSVGHDWRKDLVNRLAELQNADGSFKTIDDRWLENDPVLITAYSLLALEHASK